MRKRGEIGRGEEKGIEQKGGDGEMGRQREMEGGREIKKLECEDLTVGKNGLEGLSQTFYFVIVTINLKARKGILLYKL